MENRTSWTALKFAFVAGAAVLLALGVVRAQQVGDVRVNPAEFIGKNISVTGLVWPDVKVTTVHRGGKWIQLVKFNLYEVDPKGKKGSHYIYVSMPADRFNTLPIAKQMQTVQAEIKPPWEVASIDE